MDTVTKNNVVRRRRHQSFDSNLLRVPDRETIDESIAEVQQLESNDELQSDIKTECDLVLSALNDAEKWLCTPRLTLAVYSSRRRF